MESKENNEPIKVAQIVGKMISGGVESFLMTYYRNIDKSKVQFDFIVDEDSKYIPREEIESLGGRVLLVPPYQKIFKYMSSMKKILQENNYKIVHCHLNALSVFPLFCAKISKVPIRIAHSHSTTNKVEHLRNVIKAVLKPFSKVFANRYFSCTEHAGRWLFGNKTFDDRKVNVITNAIDVEKFEYNQDIRNNLRKELNLEDKFVVGHVGRFVTQKNHKFILQIFNDLLKQKENAILMLIGDGPLESEIRLQAENLGIVDKVMFLGVRNDVNKYIQAMDLFLFPSFYEGLGIVLIEAQCAGLPCIASKEVPQVASLTDIVEFVSLESDNKIWIDEINKLTINYERKDYKEEIKKSGYDISEEAKKLEQIYIKLGDV